MWVSSSMSESHKTQLHLPEAFMPGRTGLVLLLPLFCLLSFPALAENKTEKAAGISVNRTEEAQTIKIRPTLPADTGPEYNSTRELDLDPEIHIHWKKNH
jgi:hypothetical protein